jgi:hypothetical protein
MQYIVNEVSDKALTPIGKARIFDELADAIKFIVNINESQKLFFDGIEFSEEKVRDVLKGRLSTISVFNEADMNRKWLITAF